MNLGYMRVSSTDQNLDRQRISLTQAGVEEGCIFADKASGKDFERPAYKRMLRKLKKGDIVLVSSIDRLGRDYREIGVQWRYITQNKKADIKVLDMPLLDTTRAKDLLGTFISDLVLQVLSFVAQSERERIKQRQREGIAAAKARGVKFGRKIKPLPAGFAQTVEQVAAGELTAAAAARSLDMPRTSFYRWAKKTLADRWTDRQIPICQNLEAIPCE